MQWPAGHGGRAAVRSRTARVLPPARFPGTPRRLSAPCRRISRLASLTGLRQPQIVAALIGRASSRPLRQGSDRHSRARTDGPRHRIPYVSSAPPRAPHPSQAVRVFMWFRVRDGGGVAAQRPSSEERVGHASSTQLAIGLIYAALGRSGRARHFVGPAVRFSLGARHAARSFPLRARGASSTADDTSKEEGRYVRDRTAHPEPHKPSPARTDCDTHGKPNN